jgi:hypothetical protein
MSGRCGGATAPVAPPYVATSVAAAPQRAHRPMGQRLAPVSTPAGTSAAQRPRIGGGVRPSPLDRLTPAYGRRQPPPYVGGHACIVSPCWPPGGRLPPGGASASRQHEQIPRNGGFCIKKRSGPDSIACVTRCACSSTPDLTSSRQINRWNNQPGSRAMQSWIRDLIDLKTQISVLQNCMHAASQQPCTASQPLQGCRQCEPWTAAAAAIYPATAWPNGLLRQRPGYLRLLPHAVSRPPAATAATAAAGRLLYWILGFPWD